MKNLDFYKQELERLREELENDNYDVEQDVLDLEVQLDQRIEDNFDDENIDQWQKLLKKVKYLKKEFGFYDEESELDMMFPNRHDDDFDEDSMNIFDKD
jgi:hypothetical protein